MDGKAQKEKVKNPRASANPISALTFTWVLKTFILGFQRDLEISDLYEPLKEHKSNVLGDRITRIWEEEERRLNKQRARKKESNKDKHRNKEKWDEDKEALKHSPSLLKVLVKCFGLKFLVYGSALAFMELVLRVMQPICLVGLLLYFTTEGEDLLTAYLYAGGIILCSCVNIFVVHPHMMAILHMGMKMRIACCTLIYRKALRLSKTALGNTTIGQAVNLLSNDVNRFDIAIIFLHYLWIGPVQTIIVTCLMYREVKMSAVIGVATMLMFIPLQGYLGKKSSHLRLKTAIRTDERVRLTNEVVTGIQAIKMYTWEQPFSDLVDKSRRREVSCIRSTSYMRGIIMSFIMFTTRLSLFVTVLYYVLEGQIITAEKVFMLTAYYNILRQNMTVFFPQGITQIAELFVSVRRLETFMRYEEVSTRVKNPYSDQNGKENAGEEKVEKEPEGTISIDNASAKWLEYEEENTLKKINIHIKPGELVAIVGQVGSGKSSLLNVILKELNLNAGSIQVSGRVAYASQEPWLFAGSVRQNILFGRKMEQRKYDKVIKVCQLKRDFTLLPYGDKTVVGERGISLSGGQRARINLARAVYSDEPIYVFDDPLSAVDTHVGKHMFEECIVRYLHGKTRVLVTHQLQFLRNVDRIVVLKNGSVQAEGTYDELGAMGVDFGRLLENQAEKIAEENPSVPNSRNASRQGSISSFTSLMTNETGRADDEPEEIGEARTSGTIGGWVYLGYLRAGGNWCLLLTVLLLCVISQTSASGGDYFISYWVNNEAQAHIQDRNWYIYIFSGITVLTIVLSLVRSYCFFSMCMRASIRLHDFMFRCISRATMYFFNTNTSGRILNRFSKDMGSIDELLPSALIDCVQIGLQLLGIIVLVGYANPWLMIPTVIIGFIFYYLRQFYITTSRSVKRLEGITRSPVFSHLNATLQGLVTIRAFDADDTLVKEFDNHQDLHSSAWYVFIASSRAFGFWLDVFCLMYITIVTLSFLFMSGDSKTEGGNVGMAITQSIGLTGMFQWGMRQTAELENQMTSVERVLEYSKIESEPPLESTPEKRPPEGWPAHGKVEFKNLFLRYSVLEPPVLKGLNFVIHPREKIGIVGRTGAGKSSLIQALFRLAYLEGRIEIDGVETGEIGLHDLRSKISIIPQEPFLFSGTLRKNLDPFDKHPDSILWQVLEEVELKYMGLEGQVHEGGSNMSVGQRQLVCLARAIVRNNKVLVLDEATANVDLRTDELIQATIRHKFADCTVLTIAHRLNTVMDSDRILVMDAGQVVEFDKPHLLMQKEDGMLKSMVNETGKSMAEALTAIAERSYQDSLSTKL